MSYAAFLQSLYPDSHNVQSQVYNAVLGAIGAELDKYDPYQIGLPQEFSVTTAPGIALDRNGADWGVYRRAGELDTAYRARILAMLPIYALGDTDTGMIAMITPFTGTAPVFKDLSSDGWSWSDSAWSDSAWSDVPGYFTVLIYVQNPSHVSYNHYDMEHAVEQAKPARSRVIIYHNGTDTSTLSEAANAVITMI